MCRARNLAWICNRFSQRKGPCHGHAGARSAPAERLSGREHGVTSRANLSLAAFARAYIGRALASGCHWHQMSAARWDARSPLTTASGCLIPKSNCKLPRASNPRKLAITKLAPRSNRSASTARDFFYGRLFQVFLGGIDAGLGTGLILIGGGSADSNRADLHLVCGHNR